MKSWGPVLSKMFAQAANIPAEFWQNKISFFFQWLFTSLPLFLNNFIWVISYFLVTLLTYSSETWYVRMPISTCSFSWLNSLNKVFIGMNCGQGVYPITHPLVTRWPWTGEPQEMLLSHWGPTSAANLLQNKTDQIVLDLDWYILELSTLKMVEFIEFTEWI